MAIKVQDGYLCSYCKKLYPDPEKADACRDEHDLIYIALKKEDLGRLIQFIYLKDDKLLTESLMRQLMYYNKLSGKR